MKTHTQQKLDTILSKHHEKQQRQEEWNHQAQQQKISFLEAFRIARHDIIRPEMESIGAYLQQKGHEYTIVEQDNIIDQEHSSYDGELGMTFYFFPQEKKKTSSHSLQEYPQFTIKTRTPDMWIETGGNTRTPNGSGRDVSYRSIKIEELTAEHVNKHLVEFIEKVFDEL